MNPEIEEFARALVEHVRDLSIRSNDGALSGTAQHAVARRWREAANHSPDQFARTIIPDVVDDTLFYFLNAIDNGHLRLSYRASTGKTIDLNSAGLGELAGWYVGGDDWREKYSHERFADDSGGVDY